MHEGSRRKFYLHIYVYHALGHPSFWSQIHLQLEPYPLIEIIPASKEHRNTQSRYLATRRCGFTKDPGMTAWKTTGHGHILDSAAHPSISHDTPNHHVTLQERRPMS